MVDVKKTEQLLKEYFRIAGTYKIDPVSGVVHVQGNVRLAKNTHKLPVQFGRVSGGFYCIDSNLTSLSGAPRDVGGDFSCTSNQLTSLAGAPKRVGGVFYCANNELTTLEGAPRDVGDHFVCSNNSITSLKGAPTHVGGDFNCSRNYLTDLTHAPTQVGSFWAYNNKLSNLIGSPLHVSGLFDCSNNPLTSLEGAPDHVGGHFLITYGKDLPLLRLCGYKIIIHQSPDAVESILYKYQAQGRPGALKAAVELIGAGYPENARW